MGIGLVQFHKWFRVKVDDACFDCGARALEVWLGRRFFVFTFPRFSTGRSAR